MHGNAMENCEGAKNEVSLATEKKLQATLWAPKKEYAVLLHQRTIFFDKSTKQ